jgi:hypothetical protein
VTLDEPPNPLNAALKLIVRRQLVLPREVQEHRDALLVSLWAQSTFGLVWIVARSWVTVTHFIFTFVARQ